MAEGLWQTLGKGQWQAFSTGSKPSGYVHSLAVRTMQERDIDITTNRSKSVDEFAGQEFDIVVTVCNNAKESCPVFPGAKELLHWPFDDPADAVGSDAEKMKLFRRVREEIEERISFILEDG
jgi:arsenate reductase